MYVIRGMNHHCWGVMRNLVSSSQSQANVEGCVVLNLEISDFSQVIEERKF